jgi:hypothetical protein
VKNTFSTIAGWLVVAFVAFIVLGIFVQSQQGTRASSSDSGIDMPCSYVEC